MCCNSRYTNPQADQAQSPQANLYGNDYPIFSVILFDKDEEGDKDIAFLVGWFGKSCPSQAGI